MFLLPLVYQSYCKQKPKPMDREQFANWLSGFIDAEGNFQVYIVR